jgi:LPXTG-motif cell wall-anchored protein
MKKYIILCVVFFSWVQYAHAALQITEIMYDPKGANAGHQWIEIYNPDDNPVSIDNMWRFNDGSSHYMNDKNVFTIDPSSFFILTGDKDTFLADHPSFSGLVIDTSMSLDKDGDTVSLLKDKTVVVEATYVSSIGGSQNGDSLQNINGTWTESLPTPGVANETTPQAPAIPTPIVSPAPTPNPTPTPVAPTIIPPPAPPSPSNPIIPVSSQPIPAQVPVVPASVVTISNPIPVSVVKTTPSPKKKKLTTKKSNTSTGSAEETASTDPIDLSTLGATAGNSKADNPSSMFLWAGLGVLILTGIAGVLFMRKKKSVPTVEDYDDSLEEE